MPHRKRIGTFTLGISLVYIGIVLILTLFLNLNVILILMRCFPIVLIALGAEILLFSSRNKSDEKLKYDGVSIILILFFTFGAMSMAAAGWGIETYHNATLQHDWYNFFNEAFKINPSHHVGTVSQIMLGSLA